MKSKIIEAIDKIQHEYLVMLKNYKKTINDKNYVQIVDEISIFWNKNATIISLYIELELQPYETYVFTAVTRIDYDDNEHLPFLCLGQEHIMDDPLCTYFNTVSESPDTTYSKRLKKEIEKTIDDNISILENCLSSIYIIPIRYLYSDKSFVKEKADEYFLSLFKEKINSLDDFFGLKSIEFIDDNLRNDIKDSIIFMEHEDKNESLIERFNAFKNKYGASMIGSEDDAIVFLSCVYGNISQSLDVIFISAALKVIPYLRNEIAMRYFLIITDNIRTWYDGIEPIVLKAVIANILYNKFDKEQFSKCSLEQFTNTLKKVGFDQMIQNQLDVQKISNVDRNILAIADIITNQLTVLSNNMPDIVQ